jgi:hypothetical protein
MKVEVQLVNEKGRGVPTKERASMQAYRGVLQIQEARCHELGRIVVTAELRSGTDGDETALVPTLFEAGVLFLAKGRMRVRGTEFVGGIQYGQTWDVRVD